MAGAEWEAGREPESSLLAGRRMRLQLGPGGGVSGATINCRPPEQGRET